MNALSNIYKTEHKKSSWKRNLVKCLSRNTGSPGFSSQHRMNQPQLHVTAITVTGGRVRSSRLSSANFKFKASLDFMRLCSEKEQEEGGRIGGTDRNRGNRLRGWERILYITFNLVRHSMVLKCGVRKTISSTREISLFDSCFKIQVYC